MSCRTPIRHGEVLLLPVDELPLGLVDQASECVIAHSESGHHHVLESREVFEQIVAANGDLFVNLNAPTALRHRKNHQRHRELLIPPGAWKIVKKTEFDPRSSNQRRRYVAD